MNNLFKKAACLTDIHFGRSGNSVICNQDNLDFIEWFVDEAKTWGAETCIMLGDWHDSRNSLHLLTMNYSLRAMSLLSESFDRVYWLPGNHDLLYRNKRDISSIEFAHHLPNIKIIREPTNIGGVSLLPWLVGDEHRHLNLSGSRYTFAHAEIGGFKMNARVDMPMVDGHAGPDDFKGPEYVFSGHFHIRQNINNILYMGNIMPFNFADAGDSDRGMMFLEWGKEPVFKAWSDQPLFRVMKLSELIDTPDRLLKQKLTARVMLDIDVSYEEATFIRDTFVNSHGLRKMELIPMSKASESLQSFDDGVVFRSVDQIVIDGLLAVESTGLKPNVLVDIYRDLPSL